MLARVTLGHFKIVHTARVAAVSALLLVMCRVGSGSDTRGRAGLWEVRVKQNIKPGLHRGLGLGSGRAGLKPGLIG